jgi:hypothetical protein
MYMLARGFMSIHQWCSLYKRSYIDKNIFLSTFYPNMSSSLISDTYFFVRILRVGKCGYIRILASFILRKSCFNTLKGTFCTQYSYTL